METGPRAAPEFVEAPLQYLASAEDVTVYVTSCSRCGSEAPGSGPSARRWYYFPEMQPDEALLIKTYDSATDGRARFTLHTSFDDPTAAADAEPRESLETRCFAFF